MFENVLIIAVCCFIWIHLKCICFITFTVSCFCSSDTLHRSYVNMVEPTTNQKLKEVFQKVFDYLLQYKPDNLQPQKPASNTFLLVLVLFSTQRQWVFYDSEWLHTFLPVNVPWKELQSKHCEQLSSCRWFHWWWVSCEIFWLLIGGKI